MSELTLPTPQINPAELPEAYPPLYELTREEFSRAHDLGATALDAKDGTIPVGDEDSTATVMLTDGENPGEIVVISTSESNFGDTLSNVELTRRYGPSSAEHTSKEGASKNIPIEDQSESTTVRVIVTAETATDVPETYNLGKEDLPAFFDELEGLGRVSDVNKDLHLARYHDDLVGTSMGNIVKAMRNKTINPDNAMLRMARNAGAAINKDLMGSIITDIGKSLGSDDKKMFNQMIEGVIGHTGSVESGPLEAGIDAMVTAAQKKGHPKTAQLMLAVAYGVSYKMSNKAKVQGLREYASSRLIQSFKR